MARYTVQYERDEDGVWVASVREVKGCHTQGRSIAQARTRIREALALFVKDAAKAELVDDIKMAGELRRQLVELAKAREAATREQEKAAALTRHLAKKLAADMSRRDVGEVLGLTGQRVQQFLGKGG